MFLPLAAEGEGRSALSHLIDFTNLCNLLHPLHLHVPSWLFYSGKIYSSQHRVIQTLTRIIFKLYSVVCMANGLVAQYLLVVTLC